MRTKTLTAAVALASALTALGATTARATTPYECELQADAYAESQYPTGEGAARGATGGAVAGGVFSALTGGRVGRGAVFGGTGGLVIGSAIWQEKKQQAHDDYLAQCLQTASAPLPSPLPPTPFSSTISVNALNVRFGPGTEYQVLWQITAGQVFNVLTCEADWCWIDQNGANGYVSAVYLYPLDVAG